MSRFKVLCCVLLVFLVCCSAALADEPLPPPEPIHVCSTNHQFCIDSEPGGSTTVYNQSRSSNWAIPGWHRSIFVSNSGTVAIAYDGLNLLPPDYDPDMGLVQLWRDGQILRTVSVKEVIKSKRELKKSVSHYYWGTVDGFTSNDSLSLSLASGKKILISASSTASPSYFSEKDIGPFRVEWYSKHLKAMEEPSLSELSQTSSAESYRFTWLRTFHHPIVVRIDFRPDGIGVLTVKMTSGAGGYAPGKLIENLSRPLTREQSEWFLGRISSLSLWEQKTESEEFGCDGAQWIIEGTKNGKYHIVERWTPTEGAIRDLGLSMAIGLANLRIPQSEIY